MYFLVGLRPNLETIVTLTKPFAADGGAGVTAIGQAYRRYLARLQPDVPRAERSGGCEFVTDLERQRQLERLFDLPPTAAPAELWPGWKQDLTTRALTRLAELDPELASLFALAVDLVFTSAEDAVEVPGSATVGPAVGVVWIGPAAAWGVGEVVEALVHELAHTLLMLDEHRHSHYHSYDELQKEENFVVSAIRRERRPITGSFHSIVVAYELLTLRERLLGHDAAPLLHGSSEAMLAKTLASIESLLGMPRLDELVTPRVVELTTLVRDRLRDPAHLPSLQAEAARA